MSGTIVVSTVAGTAGVVVAGTVDEGAIASWGVSVEKRAEAIKNWKDHELFILEEIYDLVETFPDIAGVQITKAEWRTIAPVATPGGAAAAAAPPKYNVSKAPNSAAPVAAAPKNLPIKPIAKLTVKASAENEQQLKSLEAALKDHNHWNWVKTDLVPQEANTRVYELNVLPLKPEDYLYKWRF